MSKHKQHDDSMSPPSPSEYRRTLYDLRVQLVKLQGHVIRNGLRVLVVENDEQTRLAIVRSAT